MKKEIVMALFAAVILCFTMNSCQTEDPFKDKKYVATYTYNYYWKNTSSKDLSITFSDFQANRHYDMWIDKRIALTPNSVVKVENYTQVAYSTIGSEDKAPVYTLEDGISYLWYTAPMEGHQYEFGIQIGEDEYQLLDIEQHKQIFQTSNYISETKNDTTFNFYFTIDDAYLSTLTEVK